MSSEADQGVENSYATAVEANGIAAFVGGEVLVFSRSLTQEQVEGDPRMADRWDWVEQSGQSRDEIGSGQFLNALETCTFLFWPEASGHFDAWLVPTANSPKVTDSGGFYPSNDDMISCMAENAGQSFAVAVSPKGYDVIDLTLVDPE